MRPRSLGLAFVLFFAVDSNIYAQNAVAPDISGTWKLNLDKSKLLKDSKIRSETIAITCSGTTIRMRYVTNGQESNHTYIADGKEKKINENQGGEVFVKAQWKGYVLIIESSARLKLPGDPQFNGSEVIHYKERCKLSSDGRVLTVETDDPKQVSFYERVPL